MSGTSGNYKKKQQEEDEKEQFKELVATGAAVAAGIGLAAYAFGSFFSTKEKEEPPKKTVKDPAEEDEKEQLKRLAATGAVVVAAIGLADYAFGSFFSTKEEPPKKTMKAPGRPENRIYRDDFEDNPSEYFRGLRKNRS